MYGRLILFLLVVAVVVAGALALRALRWADSPAVPPELHPPSQVIFIPDGSSFQQVAALLEEARLIKSRTRFVMLGRNNGADRRIISGEYELNPSLTPKEILAKLTAGQVLLHTITIPEGYTIEQIGDLLDIDKLVDPKEFERLARDPEFIRTLRIGAPTLEGYLFPDTYRVTRGTKAKDLIRVMVEKLWQTLTPELREQMERRQMTLHETLTLASVIEKETSVGEERRLISAVFHNRLKRQIPLQSDPTVIYGLEEFDGNIRKKDLSSASPYNTYRVRGLPPGPIASPGAEAIVAALNPADASYLYFVSRNDGTHEFSSTLTQHNEAVERYQKRPFRRLAKPHA